MLPPQATKAPVFQATDTAAPKNATPLETSSKTSTPNASPTISFNAIPKVTSIVFAKSRMENSNDLEEVIYIDLLWTFEGIDNNSTEIRKNGKLYLSAGNKRVIFPWAVVYALPSGHSGNTVTFEQRDFGFPTKGYGNALEWLKLTDVTAIKASYEVH